MVWKMDSVDFKCRVCGKIYLIPKPLMNDTYYEKCPDCKSMDIYRLKNN